MVKAVLKQFGLNDKEIEVYLELIKQGDARASVLGYRLNQPRSTVQNILRKLEEEDLLTKHQHGNTYIYSARHPEELTTIADQKKWAAAKKYDKLKDDLEEVYPDLLNLMNLNHSVPNVRVFRGREAAHKILFDTLESKTELKDYANIDNMFKYVQDINDEYVTAREKTDIKKRSILLDTPFARKVYESGKYSCSSHAGYKWISQDLYPFALEMNIYDGKVSYITYVENDFTGVIIQNQHIYQMHNSMWQALWDLLPGA